MKFAEQLRRARKSKGLTQVQVCEILGVSKGTLAMWETANRCPGCDMLEKISKALGVPIVFGELSEVEAENTEEGIFLGSFRGLDTPGREAVMSVMIAEQKRIRKEMRRVNGR